MSVVVRLYARITTASKFAYISRINVGHKQLLVVTPFFL